MVFHVFGEVLEPGCLAACGGLCHPVAVCGSLWQRIGYPIRNISGGLEDVVDGWEEGTGRTEDSEGIGRTEDLRTSHTLDALGGRRIPACMDAYGFELMILMDLYRL